MLGSLRPVGSFQTNAPVYTVAYSPLDPSALLASDESGCVYILDASEESLPLRDQFHPHNNSIFDSQWSIDGTKVITASGDLTACLWDLESRGSTSFVGHTGSVKCVRNSPIWRDVYISAARDDRILIWDTREGHGREVAPIGFISEELVKPVLGNRGKRGLQSYTAVEFLCDGNLAVSCDAHEAAVKFWDLRKMVGANPTKNRSKATPKFIGAVDQFSARKVQYSTQLEQAKLSTQFLAPLTTRDTSPSRGMEEQFELRPSGSASLALSLSRQQLLVTSLSNSIFVYPAVNRVDTVPPIQLLGLKVSFYVRSQFSVDERFVVSGSQDGSLHIWDLEDMKWSATVETAHSQEVNCVSWADSTYSFLASCSDDREIKVWDF